MAAFAAAVLGESSRLVHHPHREECGARYDLHAPPAHVLQERELSKRSDTSSVISLSMERNSFWTPQRASAPTLLRAICDTLEVAACKQLFNLTFEVCCTSK